MKPRKASTSLRCGRRTFFKAMLQEVAVIHDTFKGKYSYRLSDLDSLTDEQLAQIRPVVNPACEIFVAQEYIWAKFKQVDKTYRLFSTEQKNLSVFNMFNGRNTLEQISTQLAQETGWEQASAFAHTRSLFLSLAQHLVCVPDNSLD